MTSDRKKPGLAFWATVAVVVGLVYVLSMGPIGCLRQHGFLLRQWQTDVLTGFYSPLIWLFENGPEPVHDLVAWYMGIWGVPA